MRHLFRASAPNLLSVYLIYYWLTEHLMYHRFDGQMEHKNPKVCAEYFGVKGKIGYLVYC
jgi:hypothetical protein